MSRGTELLQTGWRRIPRDWLIAGGLAILLVGVAQIPYALGYLSAGAGVEFTGTLMNPEDTNSYLAKMEQGYEGAWLYSIPFTTEPHSPAFVGGFYLLLGHLARALGLSVVAMWHLARVLAGLVLCLVVYVFVRAQVEDSRTRWLAYLLALTSSGLGWLLFLFGETTWLGAIPIDFKMPEAHLFFALLTFPHFSAGTALIVASIWLSLRTFREPSITEALAWGAVNAALAIVYPFLIYLVAAVTALLWIDLAWRERAIPWREGWAGLLAYIIPLPLLMYYYLVLRTNPVFAEWDAQAATPSPNPLHFLVAYGPLLLLAGPVLLDRQLRPLGLWALAVALLVYAPLNPQRRFVEGVQVPLSILAAEGLAGFYLPRLSRSTPVRWLTAHPRYSRRGLEMLAASVCLILLSLSNLYVLASMSITAGVVHSQPFFLPTGVFQAIDWAGANLPAGSIVLARYELGSFIPTRTGLRSVIGHWAETTEFDSKYEKVLEFYSGSTKPQQRAELISEQGVDYALLERKDRADGEASFMPVPVRLIYQNSEVALFETARGESK